MNGFFNTPLYPGSSVAGGVDVRDVGGGGLERSEELTREDVEGFGNLEEVVNEELLATGFDIYNRGAAEVGGFGELLLRQSAGPNLADSSAQRFVKGLLGGVPHGASTL